jgi:FtsZ-interacting cell division protein ZipA
LNINTTSFTSTIDIGKSKDSSNNEIYTGSPEQVFPTYAIIIIVLVAFVIIIVLGWLYYRRRNKLKSAKEPEEKMEAVWASSDMEHEAQYSKNRGSRYNQNTPNALDSNNNEDTETTFNETSIMNLPFFQHEVDVEDMSPSNANS